MGTHPRWVTLCRDRLPLIITAAPGAAGVGPDEGGKVWPGRRRTDDHWPRPRESHIVSCQILGRGHERSDLAHRLRLRLSASRQEHAGGPAGGRSRTGDRLPRRAALHLPAVPRAGRPPGGGATLPGHRTGRHGGRHGLGQPPLPRVLLRGAHDRRRAAHRERPPVARAARLHDRTMPKTTSC